MPHPELPGRALHPELAWRISHLEPTGRALHPEFAWRTLRPRPALGWRG
jgi:hypothetical protein